MSTERQLEVYRQHRNAQEKYIYFLLAAVGAAIAFAVNQTLGAKLSWSQLPLAFAVVLWALSFYFGCRYLGFVESTLLMNAELLKVSYGQHSLTGTNPQLIAAAVKIVEEKIDSKSKLASWFARAQFTCLLLGAVCYLGWHVYEMWLRTIHTTI